MPQTRYTDPSNILSKRRQAQQLRNQVGNQNYTSPWAIGADIVNAMGGWNQERQANKAEAENTRLLQDELEQILSSPGSVNAPADGMGPTFTPEHPELQEALLGQQQRMQQIEAQQAARARYGTGQGNFKGQPVTDDTGAVVGHYVQTPTGFEYVPLEGVPEGGRVNPTGYIANADPGLRGSARTEDVSDLEAETPALVDRETQIQGVRTDAQVASATGTEAAAGYMRILNSQVDEVYDAAENARGQKRAMERMQTALANGAETGLGEETILDLKQLGTTLFGVEWGPEVAEQEVVRSLSNQMALVLRNPESGMGLTGNTSNRDLTFLMDSVPGLGRSEEGNALLLEYSMKAAQAKMDLADEVTRIISENGGVTPPDLKQQISQYWAEKEIFTDTEIEKAKQIAMLDEQTDVQTLPATDTTAPVRVPW